MVKEDAKDKAEEDLKGMLRAIGLPVRASYRPMEVQALLGISDSEFWRLIRRYERNPVNGRLRHPCSLDSFMLNRSRRVRFDELVDFLRRNNSHERICG